MRSWTAEEIAGSAEIKVWALVAADTGTEAKVRVADVARVAGEVMRLMLGMSVVCDGISAWWSCVIPRVCGWLGRRHGRRKCPGNVGLGG